MVSKRRERDGNVKHMSMSRTKRKCFCPIHCTLSVGEALSIAPVIPTNRRVFRVRVLVLLLSLSKLHHTINYHTHTRKTDAFWGSTNSDHHYWSLDGMQRHHDISLVDYPKHFKSGLNYFILLLKSLYLTACKYLLIQQQL